MGTFLRAPCKLPVRPLLGKEYAVVLEEQVPGKTVLGEVNAWT